jgi:hypothetical protein
VAKADGLKLGETVVTSVKSLPAPR